MKIYSKLKDYTSTNGLCLTIGNFDGVHLGHKYLIESLLSLHSERDCHIAVMTFVPHPRVVLGGIGKRFLINTYEERRELLKQSGVQVLFELEFNRDFSSLGPDRFLEDWVFGGPKINELIVGHDFSFGANKAGDFPLIKSVCARHQVECYQQQVFYLGQLRVSSSSIRQSIENGLINEANEMLGHPFFISGTVVRGQGRGRQIGFPTANLLVDQARILPKLGVYVTKTKFKSSWYYGLTNVGVNPTFMQGSDIHVETFLFDFAQDIYGENLEVHFLNRIRDEKKFQSVNELIFQIKQDVAAAQNNLGLL